MAYLMQTGEQFDATGTIVRIAYGYTMWRGYEDVGECVNLLETFIETLAKTENVRKSDVMDRLYEKYYTVPEKAEANKSDKYKKKDKSIVRRVCILLSKGKNYSEIARTLGIDRRTVRKIAARNGFIRE